LFRVNEYIFQNQSEQAKNLLARKAERLDGVIVLQEATVLDFERFLRAVYCKCVRAFYSLSLALC
jgi:hypothetical protein